MQAILGDLACTFSGEYDNGHMQCDWIASNSGLEGYPAKTFLFLVLSDLRDDDVG